MDARLATLERYLNRIMVRAPKYWGLRALAFATRRPKIVLSALAVMVLGLFPGMAHLTVLVSIGEMLGDGPARERNQVLVDQFPSEEPLSLIFATPSGEPLGRSDLCAVKKWINEQNLRNQDVKQIDAVFFARRAEFASSSHTLRYTPLLDLGCEAGPASSDVDYAAAEASIWHGLFIGSGTSSLVVEAQIRQTPILGKFGHFSPEAVGGFITSAEALAKSRGLEFHVQGPAAFKHYFIQSLAKDQAVNLLIAAILILGCRIFFGTWISGILLVATQVVTVMILSGLMGYAREPIDILSNSLFAIIALAATEDYLFLMVALRGLEGKGRRAAFRELLLPSLFTSLTTVIGFLSLLLSDILPIRRLGLWAAGGASLEWAMCFLAVPAVLSLFPNLRLTARTYEPRPLRTVARWSSWPMSRPVKIVLLLVTMMSVTGMSRIQSNDDITTMWDATHPFSQGLDIIKRQYGFQGQWHLLVPASTSLQAQTEFWRELARTPNIVRIEHKAPVLTDMLVALPDERLRALVERELLAGNFLSRYVARDRKYERALLYLGQVDAENLAAAQKNIERLCEPLGCFLAGDLASHAMFANETISTLIESFFLSLALVSVLMFLLACALRVRGALTLIASSMWGPIVLIGMTPLVFGGINFVSCVFAAVLVGLAGDNAIQFMFAARSGSPTSGLLAKQTSALTVTVMLVTASLAYLISDFKQPRTLGLMFCAGYVLMFIGDVWLLRWLLGFVRRKEGLWSRIRLSWSEIFSSR